MDEEKGRKITVRYISDISCREANGVVVIQNDGLSHVTTRTRMILTHFPYVPLLRIAINVPTPVSIVTHTHRMLDSVTSI